MERLHYQFGTVLGLILATLIFGLAAPDNDWARLAGVVLQAATLVAAVVASRAHVWVLRIALGVSLVLIAGGVAAVLGSGELGSDSAHLIGLLLVALAPPAIVVGIVRHVSEEHGVTLQTMFGVLCLYLLIGLLFASIYSAIEEVFNQQFFTGRGTDYPADFLYFSFATLTTVGYGDLIAATDLGRSLAITEALLGQIYLVTVVAVIVGNLRAAGRGGAGRA